MDDNALHSKPKRRRRGRRGRIRPDGVKSCTREGCRGLIDVESGRDYCSFVCGVIAQEMQRTQRVCQALGTNNPMVSELWSEMVALSDGWTRHIELDRRIYRTALSVGFTDQQWQAIKAGRALGE